MPLPSFTFGRRSDDQVQGGPVQQRGDPRSSPEKASSSRTSRQTQEPLGAPFCSSTSSYSSFPSVQTSENQWRNDKEADAGPLGLTVVYEPEHGLPTADIVFVHGLGGTSRFTWSRDKNPALFWPMHFLPQEPDISQARILTFGYNANFRRKGGIGVSITDFAKDLLFDLRYTKDGQGEDLDIGKVPLIFVVHSMGGLIIKEAYLQGQNDPEYELIVKAISAITFLATPRGGTNLASMLNGILQSTFFNNSKQYISDLTQNSIALQRLNDQFRHIAPKLDIISFYETRPTSLGLKNASVMILGQDSSVLGYPGETSKALDADHHNVCKYQGVDDPNYIVVRNALKSLMSKVISNKGTSNRQHLTKLQDTRDLKALLGITDMPDSDYIFFQDQWVEGTNGWILSNSKYKQWLEVAVQDKLGSRILWLHGGPATGKSVLSSFVINELVKQGRRCQYFFIRFGDQQKRSISYVLRTIAEQIAQSIPAFAEHIFKVADGGVKFETADCRTLWETIFKNGLINLVRTARPLYWVIDGVDEANDPRALIRQFSDSFLSSLPIRILFVSRRTPEITNSFSDISTSFKKASLNIEGHEEDLRHFLLRELRLSADDNYQQKIVERIIDRSQNNFLWVRLAVDQINKCHTQYDVDLALQNLPFGMEALYDRMASSIMEMPNPGDRALTTAILECVMCSQRILTISELAQSMVEDVSKILDFQTSIVDLCAGFVVIDNGGNVAMVHQTAREYLLDAHERPLHIESNAAHHRMLSSCMKCLMTVGLRGKIAGQRAPDFLEYASAFWSKHLTQITAIDEATLNIVNKFLSGPWILTWVHYLSSKHHLDILVQVARHLTIYFARVKQYQATPCYQDSSHFQKQALLEGWSTDLIKIVGKFGSVLRQNPDAIYKMIPPFCPSNSTIYQIFGKQEARNLAVSGLSSENWDDSLARISLGSATFATSVATAGNHLAISSTSGSAMKILLYETSTFEELSFGPIRHGERVLRMCLNNTGTILVTYGYRTTKVWDVTSGDCTISVENFDVCRKPLAMILVNDTHLVVGTDDRALRSVDLTNEFPTWELVAELEEPELDGFNLNAASCMTMNHEGTLIAVASRGHPMSAWEIEGPVHLGHCWRVPEEMTFGQVSDAAWNPQYPEVFGIYMGGNIFRWKPYEDERQEITAAASKLSISRDGNLVAIGDARGTVKVFTTFDLCQIYQLTSEDTVLGLTFSPDMLRIFDIRGSYGNIWEPSALIRFAESNSRDTDRGSETGSIALSTTSFVASQSRRVDSVTTLATSPNGQFLAYGNDRGSVFLYDAHKQKANNIYTTKSFFSIEQMAWSPDGKYLVFALSARRIVVISIDSDSARSNTESFTATILVDITSRLSGTNRPISQFLFNLVSEELAVFTSDNIQIVPLQRLEDVRTTNLPRTTNGKWIVHPLDSQLMIGITTTSFIVLGWDMIERYTYNFNQPPPLEEPVNYVGRSETFSAPVETNIKEAVVDRILVKQGRNVLVIAQILLHGPHSRKKMFLNFDASWFSLSQLPSDSAQSGVALAADSEFLPEVGLENPPTSPPNPIPRHLFPREIHNEVLLVLEFTTTGQLVYLSRSFTVCTWQIASTARIPEIRKVEVRHPSVAPKSGQHFANASPSSQSSANITSAKPPSPSAANVSTQISKDIRSGSPLRHGLHGHAVTALPGLTNVASKKGVKLDVEKPAVLTKKIFHLPRDWINYDCLALSTFWLKEKSVVCPRNGEIAVVRCTALT